MCCYFNTKYRQKLIAILPPYLLRLANAPTSADGLGTAAGLNPPVRRSNRLLVEASIPGRSCREQKKPGCGSRTPTTTIRCVATATALIAAGPRLGAQVGVSVDF
jgi:hypothetical protein